MFKLLYNCTHFINLSADKKSKDAYLWSWSWREHLAMTPGLQIMETHFVFPLNPGGMNRQRGLKESKDTSYLGQSKVTAN